MPIFYRSFYFLPIILFFTFLGHFILDMSCIKYMGELWPSGIIFFFAIISYFILFILLVPVLYNFYHSIHCFPSFLLILLPIVTPLFLCLCLHLSITWTLFSLQKFPRICRHSRSPPILIRSPFSEYHINGLIQYIAFAILFISFSKMYLKFIQIGGWISGSLLFIAE